MLKFSLNLNNGAFLTRMNHITKYIYWVCASHLLTLDEENEDEEEKVYWNKIIK